MSSISGVSLLPGGGAYRFTRVLLMSVNFISACSWLLHDNKRGRSYGNMLIWGCVLPALRVDTACLLKAWRPGLVCLFLRVWVPHPLRRL